ncbi:MAG TPA: hypothetical protein VEX60_19030 [Pyrinomonadaceae bacterium]|nr:hypothetical protein [Pyrinomonadaceae bacterium]
MFIMTNGRSYLRMLAELVLLALAIFALGSLLVRAQKNAAKTGPDATPNVGISAPVTDEPLLREYRGVRLGMTIEEARIKLGVPADKSDQQDFYIFSETESAQIFYDASRKVLAVSAQYAGDGAGTPNAKSILGTDVQAREDGSVYKIVKYERAGYWVSYSRTAGDIPIVTVSMKRDAP